MFNLSIIQNRQAEAEQPKFLFQSRKKHSRDQVVGIGVGFLGTSAFGQCGSYPPILFFSSNSQKKKNSFLLPPDAIAQPASSQAMVQCRWGQGPDEGALPPADSCGAPPMVSRAEDGGSGGGCCRRRRTPDPKGAF
jgi:hypothetical protein